jgi:hypothetical protein
MGSVGLCLVLLALMPDPQRSKRSSDYSESPILSGEAITNGCVKPSAIARLLTLTSNPNVLFTIPVFLVGILRYTTLSVLIQYAYVRFKVKISTGATFYTETAIVNIFLFLFLIPQATAYIRNKYSVRPQAIDLFLVRTSVCLMSLGSLCIGLAPSKKLLPVGQSPSSFLHNCTLLTFATGVFIFASGFGSRVSALSLISYWIAPDAKATVYAAITVLESLGHAVGDPAMQQIFAASLSLETFWLAMPFFVVAVSFKIKLDDRLVLITNIQACYCLATLSATFIAIGTDDEARVRND